ncbi:hypothetical protein GUJ93_ZPchr0010g8489 [Zizania palustris]|uniref:Uncharacterized protein n=1 Tax=Zizania palustris TaxID=103762 RepID=A0A8J5W814_ZIZPA|nr:hypothetical protein GUJ93_ZPchr0010g8489 [Zizania palustris]
MEGRVANLEEEMTGIKTEIKELKEMFGEMMRLWKGKNSTQDGEKLVAADPRETIPVQHMAGKKQRRSRRMGKGGTMWEADLVVAALLLGMGDKAAMKRGRIAAGNPVFHGLIYQSMMDKATP